MRLLSLAAALVVLALAAGCTRHVEQRVELTERQRDSIIARSSLPGASVVGRAMATSDRAAADAAHAADVDTLFR